MQWQSPDGLRATVGPRLHQRAKSRSGQAHGFLVGYQILRSSSWVSNDAWFGVRSIGVYVPNHTGSQRGGMRQGGSGRRTGPGLKQK